MRAPIKISLILIFLVSVTGATGQDGVFCEGHPDLPTLIRGSAECLYDAGTGTTQIDLSTSALIEWRRFGVPSGSRTRFRFRPGTSGIVINRGLSGPAIIDGSLEAMGGALVVQNSGGSIQIGSAGSITAPSIVLTTHSEIPQDALTGIYAGADNPILNRGAIRATAGDAIILGSSVLNEAVIEAPLGNVLIAAGETVGLEGGANSLEVRSRGRGSITQRGIVRGNGIAFSAEGEVLLARGSGSLAPDDGRVFFRVGDGGSIVDEGGEVRGIQIGNGAVIENAPRFSTENDIPTSRTPSVVRFPSLTPDGRPVIRFTNSAIAGLVDSGKKAKVTRKKKPGTKVLLAGSPVTTRATTAGTWLRKSSFFGARGSTPAARPKKKK